jgi:hypothetical protein
LNESLGAMVKLTYDHEVMGSSSENTLAEMHEKFLYIRPKVVGSFLRPSVNRSYMHRAALFSLKSMVRAMKFITSAY